MGREVQRVSRDPEVTESFPPTHCDKAFGPWLCEQRQLRGLSRCFVAARTRIALERIEAIERGRVTLADDVLGRGAARQLAHAIGADAREALARMGGSDAAPIGPATPSGVPRAMLWTGGLLGLAAAGALLCAGALWWMELGVGGAEAGVVYRTDYVDDLLERRGP